MVGQADVEAQGLETEVDNGARAVPTELEATRVEQRAITWEERALERILRAPGLERALEWTLWASGLGRAVEGTLWAPGLERALEQTLWAPRLERALEQPPGTPQISQTSGIPAPSFSTSWGLLKGTIEEDLEGRIVVPQALNCPTEPQGKLPYVSALLTEGAQGLKLEDALVEGAADISG